MSVCIEYAVNADSPEDWEKLEAALKSEPGIDSYSIDQKESHVVVTTESRIALELAISIAKKSGIDLRVRGQGTQGGNLGAAVCMLHNKDIKGVVRFIQIADSMCIVEATVDGLSPGPHGFHIHQSGNLVHGCASCGEHYNPHNANHGGPEDDTRHVGDLGNIVAGQNGRAIYRAENNLVKVKNIIGRSVIITKDADDFGKGDNEASKVDGNSGEGLVVGIIASSPGLFQNSKKICLCSGKTLWEEDETPIYYPGTEGLDGEAHPVSSTEVYKIREEK